MGSSPFPTMGTTRKVGLKTLKGSPQMQWVTLRANGWGRLNLVRNAKEKNQRVSEKVE